MARHSTAIFFFTLVLLFSSCSIGTEVLLPKPDGKFSVGHNTAALVDQYRDDPLKPTSGKRKIMVSVFYPVDKCLKTCPVKYMPRTTANLTEQLLNESFFGIPNDTVSSIRLQVCCEPHPKSLEKVHKFPAVLFSPAFRTSRLNYNYMAQTLASHGYIVVTMDHTYETFIVEFPDRMIRGQNITESNFLADSKFLNARVDDADYIREALQDRNVVRKLIPGAKNRLDKKIPAIYGHSAGGATAVRALNNKNKNDKNKKYAGAFNLDGPQARVEELSDIYQPVAVFGTAEPFYHNSINDLSWNKTRAHVKGWWREIGLKSSKHPVFSDTPFIFHQLGEQHIAFNQLVVQLIIGTLAGDRSIELVTEFLKFFCDFTLNGNETSAKFFDNPGPRYPEIQVVPKPSA